MLGVTIFVSFVCIAVISGLTFWVTKLAYSRKWDDPE